MKLRPEQVAAKLDRPGPDIRLYLFHGPDTAGAMALAARLAKGVGEGAERVDMDGAMLKSRPGLLADEAASMSLFGDARCIRVTGMGEESVEAVTLLLAAERAGNPVAAIAPSVKGTSKLVKLVTASLNAVAVACYVPDAAQAAKLAVTMARDHGLRLLGDVPDRLAAVTAGDRAVLASEIEKLALYLDASPERPRDADGEAFDAIGASIADAELGGIVSAMIAGDAAAAALPEMPGGAIPVLRAVARRLLSLAEMRADIDDGDSVDRVMERHRVFFKEQAATATGAAPLGRDPPCPRPRTRPRCRACGAVGQRSGRGDDRRRSHRHRPRGGPRQIIHKSVCTTANALLGARSCQPRGRPQGVHVRSWRNW